MADSPLDDYEGGNETDTGFSRSRTPVLAGTSASIIEVEEDNDGAGGGLNLHRLRRDLDDDDAAVSVDPHAEPVYPSLGSYDPDSLPPLTAAPWGHWTEDDIRLLKIRGPTFLSDKVKIPTGAPVYRLAWVDMFSMSRDERCPHVASRPESYAYLYHEHRMHKMRERHGDKAVSTPVDAGSPSYLSPMLIINFLFPGPSGENMNLVLYMTRRVRPAYQIIAERERKERRKGGGIGKRRPSLNGRTGGGTGSNPSSPPVSPVPRPASSHTRPSPLSSSRTLGSSSVSVSSRSASSSLSRGEEKEESSALEQDPDVLDASIDLQRLSAFDRCMKIFLEGDDHERDSRLKIIPRIAEGPWLVKKGVGTTPAILGRKVKQLYYRNLYKNYIEIDADVGSSVVAGKILSLVKSAATSLIIELSFLFQGETEDELPESLLTGVRIVHPSLANTVSYSDNWQRTRELMRFPL